MLARFVDRRRLNAIFLVVLGLAIPPAFLLGGAAGGVATLRRGLTDGVAVSLAGWGAVAALLVLLGGPLPASLVVMLAMLLAVVALCAILRSTASLELTLVAALGLALLGLSLFWAALDDPLAYWQATFGQALDQLIASGAEISPEDREALLASLQLQAFTGNLVATLLLVTLGSVFMARSWQAQIVNPGGFQDQFRRLRLGQTAVLLSAAVFLGAAMSPPGWLLNAAAILMWIWVIQGLSVIHAIVGGLKASSGWLVATYLALIFGWSAGMPLAMVVPVLGVVNNFFDLRGYVLRNRNNGD